MLVLWLAIVPARRATSTLLVIEGLTVLLIVVIALIAFIQMAAGTAPGGAELTLDVFKVEPGTDTSTLFLGIIFGLLSFAGFEAAATLGEEARNPRRDIPRAILGTAIFGGIYFTFVTAVEMMAFGTDAEGVEAFVGSGALMGDIGTAYIASWVGETVTLGAAVSAFACCLACVVGASRLLYAVSRDASPGLAISRTGRNDTPAAAAVVVSVVIALIALVCAVFFGAEPFDTFLWSGTIGTLILLVAYVLATIGCIKLLFVDRKMEVPMWEVVIPLAALVMLGYTIWRNVIPYPDANPAQWFPVVAFGWVLLVAIVMLASPGLARKLSLSLEKADETREHPVTDETPYVAGPLVDHHCHGLVRRDLDRPAFESLMNEGAGAGRWTGSPFDSMLGVAILRHCAPLLGLEPHADADTYLGRRQALGHDEVARRLLGAAGIDTLLVDTGFLPDDICSPAEVAALAGPDTRSHEIARLETIAQDLLASGTEPRELLAAVGQRLAESEAVGAKSIAAYRCGLDLLGERPRDIDVGAALHESAPGRLRRVLAHHRPHRDQRPGLDRDRRGPAACSSTSGTATTTSTCSGATRCSSRRSCARRSPAASRCCCCTTTRSTATRRTWRRSSTTSSWTSAWRCTTPARSRGG